MLFTLGLIVRNTKFFTEKFKASHFEKRPNYVDVSLYKTVSNLLDSPALLALLTSTFLEHLNFKILHKIQAVLDLMI